jgi:hypothetical protein
MYPEFICDEGDCTSYGVVTFNSAFADDCPSTLYGKHYCTRHAYYILRDLYIENATCPECHGLVGHAVNCSKVKDEH